MAQGSEKGARGAELRRELAIDMMRRMNVGQSANKQIMVRELLNLGMVLVALDARHDGVDVPAHLSADAQLRLNLSYRFGLPITIDDVGITATLTFSGVPHVCRLPWTAIFLLVSHVNGEPYLFPADVPDELREGGDAALGWRLRQDMERARDARPPLQLLSALQHGETVRATLAPRGRKKAGRRASGGFAAVARRLEREQARGQATSSSKGTGEDSSQAEAPLMPPHAAETETKRARGHLRIVK